MFEIIKTCHVINDKLYPLEEDRVDLTKIVYISESSQHKKYGPSKNSYNKGIFASRNISKDTILCGRFETYGGTYFTLHMNDTDMIYPTNWSYESLLNTFHEYRNSNKCNVVEIKAKDTHNGKESLVAIKDIKIGDELTFHRGTLKWIESFLLHLLIANYPNDITKEPPVNVINLMKVAATLGYSSLYDELINQIKKASSRGKIDRIALTSITICTCLLVDHNP